jgi:hypothetical protein
VKSPLGSMFYHEVIFALFRQATDAIARQPAARIADY